MSNPKARCQSEKNENRVQGGLSLNTKYRYENYQPYIHNHQNISIEAIEAKSSQNSANSSSGSGGNKCLVQWLSSLRIKTNHTIFYTP